ncbi:hypothetical protein ALT_7184 [Aspergillus lentulus]|uniref:Uncharacterized protein n=2 Tax=Aspergillus lentulus TaxID=293939 RepID=A0AAN4TDE7_ASPLE|nr:uncharacterized protein IFM58399_02851 [Aspergillus lentulus]GAQ09863.1 hypothetical protein ALT_7184 [Aspergillus lentulus]GFF31329.1 hypothetical protein IFM58399_02851 [Aspergillus lentulus]
MPPIRIPISRSLRPYNHVRFLATKPSGSSGNPISSNPQAYSINKARGREAGHSDEADTRSVQSPVSMHRAHPSEAHEGEEQTSADAMIKNDPNEPTEKKRENVEKAGSRKMGPEDEQKSRRSRV